MGADSNGRLAERVRDIVLSDFGQEATPMKAASKKPWGRVKACGTELWLDTGDIDEASSLWCEEFSAVTTNNTLLNREVQKGTYDELVARVADELRGEAPEEDLPLEIAFVLNAYHGLMISRQLDAMVSVELHTDLAHDVQRSVAYGRRYHEIAPDRFYIKVPLTPAGLLAARQLSEDGIPVNFTLGFSARQNYLITAIARPAFVNVFLGRLNAVVADHGLGSGELVGEKATLASQQAVLELRAQTGVATRQIAASMRGGGQVLSLAGVDVLTMPTKVVREFEESSPSMEAIRSQVGAELEVELADGVDGEAVGLDTLWDVPQDLKRAVTALAGGDVLGKSPEALCGFFAEEGLPGLLPVWTAEEFQAITGDGKIPKLDRWQERIARRQIGLDALMNVSGLQSFAVDQQAMDERILSML
jgi:transaldolase